MRTRKEATHEEHLTVADEITVLLARDLTQTYEDIERHNQEVGWFMSSQHEPLSLCEADLRRAWELGARERAAMGYTI